MGTVDELKKIATNYGNMDVLPMSGITVGGTKYMFLSCADRVMRGKKGTSGVHIMKTNQAILISVYEEPVVPEECATVTEKLGEYSSVSTTKGLDCSRICFYFDTIAVFYQNMCIFLLI